MPARWGHTRDTGQDGPPPAGASLGTEARMDSRLPGPHSGQRPQDGTPARRGHARDRG